MTPGGRDSKKFGFGLNTAQPTQPSPRTAFGRQIGGDAVRQTPPLQPSPEPPAELKPESEPASEAAAEPVQPAPVRPVKVATKKNAPEVLTEEPEAPSSPAPQPEPIAPFAAGFLAEPDSEGVRPPIEPDQLPERVRQALANAGWESLMSVQARAMPYMLSGEDLMVQSRTGSGKTGAFTLPILERIDPKLNACQALVLAPTRELAGQVYTEAKMLAGDSGVRAEAFYGGVGYGQQLDALKAGCHLVVGTPGRILDHLMRGALKLDKLKMMVFDEADRMLSMGFLPDMIELKRYLPRERVSCMFSATFPLNVQRLATQFLTKPRFLNLSQDNMNVAEVQQLVYECPAMEKDRALVRVIETENPESAIVFCNTRRRVNYVATVLQRFGYDADQLSADLNQNAREAVLKRIYDHKLRFLVATDVAARGIDVQNLTHVIQYEVPDDQELFIHRSGRTGRAGASGTSITLCDPLERNRFNTIVNRYELQYELRETPTEEDVADLVAQRITAQLEAKLRKRDRLMIERMKRFSPMVRSLIENEEGLSLLDMLVDDYYQAWQHDAPLMDPAGEAAPPKPAPKSAPEPSRKTGGDRRSVRRRRR